MLIRVTFCCRDILKFLNIRRHDFDILERRYCKESTFRPPTDGNTYPMRDKKIYLSKKEDFQMFLVCALDFELKMACCCLRIADSDVSRK